MLLLIQNIFQPVAYLGGALGDAPPPLAWTQNFFEHIEPKKI